MATGERIFRFGDEEITAPAEMSAEEVRSTWATFHPALENSDIVEEDDGSITFRQRGGTKGC